MSTAEMTEQINNGELPDDLDYSASWQTFANQQATDLDIPEETWAEALDWAGIDNVLKEHPYDYHIPSMGMWEQDACIDFSPGISPTGAILFEAVMYKAKITRKQSFTYRDQELCRAFLLWNPDSPVTSDCITRFIRQNP